MWILSKVSLFFGHSLSETEPHPMYWSKALCFLTISKRQWCFQSSNWQDHCAGPSFIFSLSLQVLVMPRVRHASRPLCLQKSLPVCISSLFGTPGEYFFQVWVFLCCCCLFLKSTHRQRRYVDDLPFPHLHYRCCSVLLVWVFFLNQSQGCTLQSLWGVS